MKNLLKKNLWWIISSIVLFIPLACMLHSLSIAADEKIVIGCILFAIQFLIGAIAGVVANKIKKILFKVLWVITMLVVNAIFWIISIVFMAFCEPITEDELNCRKEEFREMVYSEFDEENHLDKIVGIELPQYKIVDSECTYVSIPPTETEYDVKLKIHFPDGLPQSLWNDITELASTEAANRQADDNEDKVINRWFFKEENPKAISFQCENKSNVSSTITFESDCDTVYVSRYKW